MNTTIGTFEYVEMFDAGTSTSGKEWQKCRECLGAGTLNPSNRDGGYPCPSCGGSGREFPEAKP